MKFYLRVGVVFQVPDQIAAEVADIGLEFSDVVPETVQLCDHDLVTVGATITMAPADDSPGHHDDQDSDGSDDLGQSCEVLHLGLLVYPATDLVIFIDLNGQRLDADMGRYTGLLTSDRVGRTVYRMRYAPADQLA